jgi:ABC-type Co2+ transport system permease subunit
MKLDYATPPKPDGSSEPRCHPVVSGLGAILYGLLTCLFLLPMIATIMLGRRGMFRIGPELAVLGVLAGFCGWRAFAASRSFVRNITKRQK